MPSGPESAQARVAWPPAGSHATTPSLDTLTTDTAGGRGPLFWLTFKTGVLTVLTLGIYRFWMKTRLRRWFWSSIRPGGHPLEYVGDPFEKLLGFLFAVVILAFYIGVVNLILMFASFSLFQGNFAAYLASLIGVIPLWFFAKYRARRYILARTRWRGLRFGLEPGAWGYAGRAVVHWLITLLSLGLLWPRMTFWLEKYKTDRTFFGSARMHQGGDWKMLYPALKPMAAAVLLGGISAAVIVMDRIAVGAGLAIIASFFAIYGLVHYRVETLRLLTETKTVNGVALGLNPDPFRVMVIYVLGTLLALVSVFIPFVFFTTLVLMLQSATALELMGLENLIILSQQFGRITTLTLSVMMYFLVFVLWSALTNAFVTLPIIRHYFGSLTLCPATQIDLIRQRPRDEFEEAEGFAEALDVGASL
ncbi:DUF898 family protein [Marivita sp. S0852]|uniref:DUF898 family protein n=1 Tax=Marivita sp. S0852 TaxID=3373893 RepID=UPI0039821FD2